MKNIVRNKIVRELFLIRQYQWGASHQSVKNRNGYADSDFVDNSKIIGVGRLTCQAKIVTRNEPADFLWKIKHIEWYNQAIGASSCLRRAESVNPRLAKFHIKNYEYGITNDDYDWNDWIRILGTESASEL